MLEARIAMPEAKTKDRGTTKPISDENLSWKRPPNSHGCNRENSALYGKRHNIWQPARKMMVRIKRVQMT